MTATRIRRGTYGERARYNWRLPADLHEQISDAATIEQITTTAFVLDHLGKAATKPTPARQKQRFEDASFRGQVVAVTLRISDDEMAIIRKAAKAAGFSLNRYITFVAWCAVAKKAGQDD